MEKEKDGISKLIDVTEANAELQRGIGDIFLCIQQAVLGKTHICINNTDPLVSQIINTLTKNADTIKNHWIK
jgi:hypothetical protein